MSKKYHAPATPCDRLLQSSAVTESVKSNLRAQFASLDPVRLLRDIRASQAVLALTDSVGSPGTAMSTLKPIGLPEHLQGLATAWKAGEVRPTHRRKVPEARWWRTRSDPFEHAWPVIEGWLVDYPTVTVKELMGRLSRTVPDAYSGNAQLRTLQRRIKTWRAEKAKDLILGRLRKVTAAGLETSQGVEP